MAWQQCRNGHDATWDNLKRNGSIYKCLDCGVAINHGTLDIETRLFFYLVPEPNTGCWLWLGTIDFGGYSQIKFNGRSVSAHRVMYELVNGELPSEVHLDHLCRTRSCVNPEHLDEVSLVENVARGTSDAAVVIRTGYCKRGHEFVGRNVRVRALTGERQCAECRRELSRTPKARAAQRSYNARKRVERMAS